MPFGVFGPGHGLGHYSFVFFGASISLGGCNAKPCIRAHIVFGAPKPLSYIRSRNTYLAEEFLDEIFSVETVKIGHGVVIDPISRVLDRKATAELRGQMARTEASQQDAESHVEHFVRSLGLDPRLRYRTKASRSG